MHFGTILSYDLLDKDSIEINLDENGNPAKDNTKECSVCLEKNYGKTHEKTKRMSWFLKNNYTHIIKSCNCDCVIHSRCLKRWLSKNNTCIICRKDFEEQIVFDYIEINKNIQTNNEMNEMITYIVKTCFATFLIYKILIATILTVVHVSLYILS